MLTDLKKEKEKHGPAVYLSLSGKARDVVSTIATEDVGKEGGADTIIEN